jgi:Cd2+/Zn2+-exporting ATPase
MPILTDVSFKTSLYRALTFLVISCPCAIAISVPLSYFTGIGVASKKGILIKGSNYLDNLSNAKNIIFDKTGTLTNGSFMVMNLEILDDKYTKHEIIDILIKGESFSNHPIAKSIMRLSDEKIDNSDVINFKEIEGKGISYTLNGDKIVIGNKKVCNCDIDAYLHLNINGKHVASVSINDGIKENAKATIDKIKNYGIKTYMFTGDKKEVALDIGKKLEIDEIHFEMLPTDKFSNFESVSQSGISIFVGDGINDAPVLRRADIGISMGGVGSSSAIEASDVVLMNDDLEKIPQAIDISCYTSHIIKENLIFAIAVKLIILLLSLFGLANMWMAVFADTGVTLLTIINTLRIIKKFK